MRLITNTQSHILVLQDILHFKMSFSEFQIEKLIEMESKNLRGLGMSPL